MTRFTALLVLLALAAICGHAADAGSMIIA